jgi:hypothetical protein
MQKAWQRYNRGEVRPEADKGRFRALCEGMEQAFWAHFSHAHVKVRILDTYILLISSSPRYEEWK